MQAFGTIPLQEAYLIKMALNSTNDDPLDNQVDAEALIVKLQQPPTAVLDVSGFLATDEMHHTQAAKGTQDHREERTARICTRWLHVTVSRVAGQSNRDNMQGPPPPYPTLPLRKARN